MSTAVKFDNVQAVLFDLDGTLIDSAPDLGAAVDKMRLARGMSSLPLSHYRPMAGAGARGIDLEVGARGLGGTRLTHAEELGASGEIAAHCIHERGDDLASGRVEQRGAPGPLLPRGMRSA